MDQKTPAATPTINREFAEHLLRCFDDPHGNPVHAMFNLWWQYASEEVKAKYVADFRLVPEQRRWFEEGWFAEPLDIEALARLPANTLGAHYRRFIVDNGLEAKIATNYRQFHQMLRASGVLKGMPLECEYAVLRGFQTHDFQHVLTGYRATPRAEIALQAFCLAQIRFPYFGMWISVVTTRMTYLDPDSIRPIMDDISEGWQYGRRARNIQFLRFEEMLERPIDDIRREYGLAVRDEELERLAA